MEPAKDELEFYKFKTKLLEEKIVIKEAAVVDFEESKDRLHAANEALQEARNLNIETFKEQMNKIK